MTTFVRALLVPEGLAFAGMWLLCSLGGGLIYHRSLERRWVRGAFNGTLLAWVLHGLITAVMG